MEPIYSKALLALLVLTPLARGQTWEASAQGLFSATAPNDGLGFVLGDAGDVDGDGRHEVLISAPFKGAGLTAANGWVYLVDADGDLVHSFIGTSGQDNLGHSVACAGDADGDGHADVVLGAPNLNGVREGCVRLYSGATGGLLQEWSGEQAGDRFGWVVAGAGDVDGDGRGDVIVGAPGNDEVAMGAGKAYVFSGANGSLIHEWTGPAAADRFGGSVGAAGDRDGDGHADVMVCAPQAGPGDRGQAFVYSGVDGALMCTIQSPPAGVDFGNYFCGLAGDVDADGTLDIYVIDYLHGQQRGRVYVYSGVDCSLIHSIRGPAGSLYLFGRVRMGDLDGDGHDDLFLCSGQNDDGGLNAGAGYVYSGATGEPLGQFTGEAAGMRLGTDACGVGDVTGDGVPDFAIGVGDLGGGHGALVFLSGAPAPPSTYCEGSLNSAQLRATMGYAQSLSWQQNVFELEAEDAVASRSGVFFAGPGEAAVPFGSGALCVSGPIRLGTAMTDAAGAARLPLDFTGSPANTLVPGTTWRFQFWYRDPADLVGFQLTNALRATFRP